MSISRISETYLALDGKPVYWIDPYKHYRSFCLPHNHDDQLISLDWLPVVESVGRLNRQPDLYPCPRGVLYIFTYVVREPPVLIRNADSLLIR